MPHIAAATDKKINKTALGAQNLIGWQHFGNIAECITALKADNYKIYGLEIHQQAVPIGSIKFEEKTALIAGNEVDGINEEVLKLCDAIVYIPMKGKKESFNVASAAAIAAYHIMSVA